MGSKLKQILHTKHNASICTQNDAPSRQSLGKGQLKPLKSKTHEDG